MRLNDFQDEARKTAMYPESGLLGGLGYTIIGLVGETGELANKFKKILRDGDSPEKRAALIDELADVCWYVAMVADELEVSLETVAQRNLDKLRSRTNRGVIGGSGDNR